MDSGGRAPCAELPGVEPTESLFYPAQRGADRADGEGRLYSARLECRASARDRHTKSHSDCDRSEVGLALAAIEPLALRGIAARVVSMPTTTVFDRQDAQWREHVLPRGVKR